MSADAPRDPTGQRAAPRAGTVFEVQFRTTSQFLICYCTNISRGGLFVSTPTPAKLGEVLTLSLGIPGIDGDVDVAARVRWVREMASQEGPAGMGLSFEQIDDRLGDHIDRIVASPARVSIEMVGGRDQGWRHLESLVRSLLNCRTRLWLPDEVDLAALQHADLLVFEVEANPARCINLIETLATQAASAPIIALVGGRAPLLRQRVEAHALVVATPVDKLELQRAILDSLARVHATRFSP